MQRTLLDFTQDILSSLGSDEVNSIDDTLESQSVAKIVRRSFYNVVDLTDVPNQKELFSLEASLDSSKPTLMTKPNDVRNVEWIKYDKRTASDTISVFTKIDYQEPEEFLYLMHQRDNGDTNVESFTHNVDTSIITFFIYNDQGPKYWTSFDDSTIFFDAYDAAVDSTLQKSKTICYGGKLFAFSLTDSFIPPLNDEQQNLVLNEAISLAWLELKQSGNQKAEASSRRGKIRQQHTKQTLPKEIPALDRAPNFGRK